MGNPYVSGFPWANTANYAAGSSPWSASPTKVSPIYTFFTPSPTFAPTAQELNAVLNQVTAAITYNAGAVGNYAAIEEVYADADGGDGTNYFIGAGWQTGTSGYSAGKAQILGSTAITTAAGDIIDVSLASSLFMNPSTTQTLRYRVAVGYQENGGTFTNFPGGEAQRTSVSIATGEITPFSLLGRRVVATPGTFSVGVNACIDANGGANPTAYSLTTAWALRIRHLRANP